MNKTIISFKVLLLTLVITNTSVLAQERFKLKDSEVIFFSEAPLENITAKNSESIGVIDISKNNFAFRVPIKSFVFPKQLMQEHFNENYLESDKFPTGTFRGTIEGDFDIKKDGRYPIIAKGELDIHGVKKQREITATILVKNNKLSLESKFIVKLVDHDIKIPSIVFNNIAEEIEVTIKSSLEKM